MTFPSPFQMPEVPGFGDAATLQAENGTEIQSIADRLYQHGADAQKRIKTALATGIKGKLVRSAAREQKANSQERTRIAAQMRNVGENAQADLDSEIMRLAPRLGQYEAEAALMQPVPIAPVAQAVLPGGGPTPPIQRSPLPLPRQPIGAPIRLPEPENSCPPGYVADWIYLPNPTGVVYDTPGLNGQCMPNAGPGPPPAPAGYTFFGWNYAHCQWSYRRCTPIGGDGGPPPVPPPAPPPGAPPPVPLPCPPCPPTRCGPDGIPLLGPPVCPQGPPADAGKSASYIVPWLSGGETVPSIYSDCGLKLIHDAAGHMDSAAELVNALSSPRWVNTFLGDPRAAGGMAPVGEADLAEDAIDGRIYRE